MRMKVPSTPKPSDNMKNSSSPRRLPLSRIKMVRTTGSRQPAANTPLLPPCNSSITGLRAQIQQNIDFLYPNEHWIILVKCEREHDGNRKFLESDNNGGYVLDKQWQRRVAQSHDGDAEPLAWRAVILNTKDNSRTFYGVARGSVELALCSVLELTGLYVAIEVPGTAVDNPKSMTKKDEQAGSGVGEDIEVPGTAVDNPTSMIKKDEQAVSKDGEDIEVPGNAIDCPTSMTRKYEQAGSGDGALESTFF
ncbi:hypothetical protein D6D21_09861 [Aureobasidium pullulans]|uniref:Uncharacterized protein n=1 Tax=Aureobasidium pullulans TaxID=5580 RepID=A0AB74IJK6_AURPU|nr:hypothetical protein D6D21_09861 [Aureobasidium pullulans]